MKKLFCLLAVSVIGFLILAIIVIRITAGAAKVVTKVEKEAFSPCFSVDMDSSTPRPPNKRAGNQLIAEAVIMKNWLWTHETTVTVETDKTLILKVRFLDGQSSERARVKRVAPEWSKHADIRFEFVDSGPSDIRIGFDPNDGHWSYIGRAAISKTKTMNLASGHTDRVILHEFGHALGLKHEHQNPAVSIRWNEQAVLAEYRKRQKWSDDKIRRNVLNRLNVDQTNFTEFDPASIMLYAIPNRWTIGDFETGYNRELSATDKRFIGEQYGRPAQSSGMVLIPAGEFQMGSNDGDYDEAVHTVYVDAFYMDKYEVAVGQYKQFVRATGHRALPDWVSEHSPTDRHPVTGVSWYDAMAYAAWDGKRLPTEAEWEKAARGGLSGQKYPWGNAIDPSKANYSGHVGKTAPVGRYAPNGYGLYDMAGNVWEWCLDKYDEGFYWRSPRSNPIAGGTITSIIQNFTNVKTERVLRGGSWFSSPRGLRVANRDRYAPSDAPSRSGFRCARDQ